MKSLRDSLPPEMLAARRWLVWRLVPAEMAGEKDRKVPYYVDGTARRGQLDTPEDTSRLASFDEAMARLKGSRFVGLGFALGDGWQGVDLDDHRNPKNGELSDLAKGVLDDAGSYAEVSPSGCGVHIIGRGKEFPAIAASATECGIEAYSGK